MNWNNFWLNQNKYVKMALMDSCLRKRMKFDEVTIDKIALTMRRVISSYVKQPQEIEDYYSEVLVKLDKLIQRAEQKSLVVDLRLDETIINRTIIKNAVIDILRARNGRYYDEEGKCHIGINPKWLEPSYCYQVDDAETKRRKERERKRRYRARKKLELQKKSEENLD